MMTAIGVYCCPIMASFNAPLPKKITDEMFDSWQSIFDRHESGCSLALPGSNRQYRVAQFISERAIAQGDMIFVPMVLQSYDFESWEELKIRFDSLRAKSGRQLVVFVLDGQWLLTWAPHILSSIQSYIIESGRTISILFFLETNIYASQYAQIREVCPSLIQNVHYHTLFEPEIVRHYLQEMSDAYGYNLPAEDADLIVRKCGGHLWLATEALRHLHATGEASFDHDSFMFRVKSIWERFSPDEQKILTSVALGERRSLMDNLTLTHFSKLRLICKNTLTVPVLLEYVYSFRLQEKVLTVTKDDHLEINQVPVDKFFTKREKDLLAYFVSNVDHLVTRDEAARLLWGDNWQEQCSDWALDQCVKRLRDKLKELGLSANKLKTMKGIGYRYVSS